MCWDYRCKLSHSPCILTRSHLMQAPLKMQRIGMTAGERVRGSINCVQYLMSRQLQWQQVKFTFWGIMALVYQPCPQKMRQCRSYIAVSHVLLYVSRYWKVKALYITMNCHKCTLSGKGFVVLWMTTVPQRLMHLNTTSPLESLWKL